MFEKQTHVKWGEGRGNVMRPHCYKIFEILIIVQLTFLKMSV